MYKVALTGLIGAGKTTVCEIFSKLGIPCYISDIKAKELMTDVLKSKIESLLGKDAYINGLLNKNYISEKIFSNNNLRAELNSIVHPAVKNDFLTWADNQKSQYVIIETALLLESSINTIVDKTILVSASTESRIKRVMHRDNSPKNLVISKIKSQVDDSKLIKFADYIICNDDCSLIIPQVLEIDNNIRNLSK